MSDIPTIAAKMIAELRSKTTAPALVVAWPSWTNRGKTWVALEAKANGKQFIFPHIIPDDQAEGLMEELRRSEPMNF